MGNLFATGGLHSCLWLDASRFNESWVPPLVEPMVTIMLDVLMRLLWPPEKVINEKNSIKLPFISFLWNLIPMRSIIHTDSDITALTKFIQKMYTNPIILISLYQDIILRMVKYYCDQKRDTAVKIQILFTKMVYVVFKKSGTI